MDFLTAPLGWIAGSVYGNLMAAAAVVVLLSVFLGRAILSRKGIIAAAAIAMLVVGGGAVYRWLNTFDGPGFAFYEGNAGAQSNVCNVSDTPATISLSNHPCPNDEIRSVRLLKLKKGTVLRVFDHPEGKLEDDWAEIVLLEDVEDYVVSSFEAPQGSDVVRLHYSRNNGLDGKISRVQVMRTEDPDAGSLSATIAFYEGDNLTQNKVCELPLRMPTELNFKNSAECDNDEARSAVLRNVPANTRIRLFDDPDGSRKDDWIDIIVLAATPELRLPTFEVNEDKPAHRLQYHRNNGLQGKVSRLEIKAGGPEPVMVLYEGNGGSQNIVCSIDLGRDFRARMSDLGCANDEARSAVLYNLPKDVSIRLFDSPGLEKNDDWTEIVLLQPVVTETVSSFERNAENPKVAVHAHRHNGLDGKVSAVEVARSPHPPVIDLFEGNNGSQNRLCSIAAAGGTTLRLTAGSNGGCANDEARSMVLHRLPVGTAIRVYDHPDGRLQDDWSEIEVTELRSFIVIPGFQNRIESGPVRLRYFRNNGLDGKVSRVEIATAAATGGFLSFYEGNNAGQNKVCDLEAAPSGRINFKSGSQCRNDEARSVMLTDVKAGYVFSVFDDPDCRTGDDWAQIQVLRDTATLVVRSFQQNVTADAVKVTYHRKNGLDGKVSCVRFGQ